MGGGTAPAVGAEAGRVPVGGARRAAGAGGVAGPAAGAEQGKGPGAHAGPRVAGLPDGPLGRITFNTQLPDDVSC